MHSLLHCPTALAADASREASSGAGSADQPAAKRAKVDGPAGSAAAAVRPAGMPLMQHPAALAAMAGGRPPLPPGMTLPGMMAQQVTAAQASAAAQLRLQQQLAAKQFPPIIRCALRRAALCCAVLCCACSSLCPRCFGVQAELSGVQPCC